ncbi:MAG: hypothetical protein AB8I08_27850 [Sandaracinaceae bacterium]
MSAPSPPPMQTFLILYLALLASTFVYLGLLLSGLLVVAPAEDSTLAFGVAASAVGVLAASWFVPRMIHGAAVSALELTIEEIPDPNGSVMFREQTPTIRSFADPERADAEARRVYFTPFILRLAFNEAIALFGFVLGMLGYAPAVVLPFFVVSWVLFAFSAPRPSRWRAPLVAHFDAQLER